MIFPVLFTLINQKHSHGEDATSFALRGRSFRFVNRRVSKLPTAGCSCCCQVPNGRRVCPLLSTMHFTSCFSHSPPSSTCPRLLIYGGLLPPSLPTGPYCSFTASLCLNVPTPQSKMRYQDWDILLFPEGSKAPIQEFKTQCHVTLDLGEA